MCIRDSRTAAAAALYIKDRANVQPIDRRLSLRPQNLTYDEQSYAALICRLKVSPVIHAITWITTHWLTLRDGRLSWPGWLNHSKHLTHNVV